MTRHSLFFSLGSIGLASGALSIGCGGGNTADESSSKDDVNACPTVAPMAARPSQGVAQLSVAGDHNCALLVGGTVRCWGEASYGVLGYGNANDIGDDEAPFSAGDVDVGGVVEAVSTNFLNTCALLTDGTVRCWGAVHTGILDAEATEIVGDDEPPASRPVISFGQPAIQIAVGTGHACVLLEDKSVLCWGSNEEGELGIASSRGEIAAPASEAIDLGGPVATIFAGNGKTCAVLEDGAVRCWGSGGIAGIGYGNTDVIGDDEAPSAVGPVSLGAPAHAIAVGRFDQCAILDCGVLRCWGLNRFGSAGVPLDQAIGDDELPDSVPAIEIGGPVKRVSVGTEIADERSCAVLFDNTVRCWGWSWSNSEDKRPVAGASFDLGGPVSDVSVGDTHACALLENGSVHCWGNGTSGQLGGGPGMPLSTNQPVEALVVTP